MTNFYGDGGTDMFPTSTKLGGMYMCQTDDPNKGTIQLSDFWWTKTGLSMSQVYGNQGTNLGSNTFVWAS